MASKSTESKATHIDTQNEDTLTKSIDFNSVRDALSFTTTAKRFLNFDQQHSFYENNLDPKRIPEGNQLLNDRKFKTLFWLDPAFRKEGIWFADQVWLRYMAAKGFALFPPLNVGGVAVWRHRQAMAAAIGMNMFDNTRFVMPYFDELLDVYNECGLSSVLPLLSVNRHIIPLLYLQHTLYRHRWISTFLMNIQFLIRAFEFGLITNIDITNNLYVGTLVRVTRIEQSTTHIPVILKCKNPKDLRLLLLQYSVVVGEDNPLWPERIRRINWDDPTDVALFFAEMRDPVVLGVVEEEEEAEVVEE